MSLISDLLQARKNRQLVGQLKGEVKKGAAKSKEEQRRLSKENRELKKNQRPSPETRGYQTERHRQGTLETLALIESALDASCRTAIEIGCAPTAVTIGALAGLGLVSFGINPTAVSLVNEFPLLTYLNGTVTPENLESLEEVDVVLLLSVHHQFVDFLGEEAGNKLLIAIAKKARKQFFFSPALICSKYGVGFSRFTDNDMQQMTSYLEPLLAEAGFGMRYLGMAANELPPWEPQRPVFVCERASFKPTRTVSYSLNELMARPLQEIFEVPVADCRGAFGRAFNSNHYFTRCVAAWQGGKQADAAFNALADYYRSFQPKNLAESFGVQSEELAALPVAHHRMLPWLTPTNWGHYTFGVKPTFLNHGAGPMDDLGIKANADSLIKLVDSFVSEGYQPYCKHDGFLRGYFLCKGNEKRFHLCGGQHRAAVMAQLGMTTARVRLTLSHGFPRSVDRAEVKSWPLVQAGWYSEQAALALFDAVFDGR
jgi:hypothetical protein